MQENKTGCGTVILMLLKSSLKGVFWALLVGGAALGVRALYVRTGDWLASVPTISCGWVILALIGFFYLFGFIVDFIAPTPGTQTRSRLRSYDINNYDNYNND